MRGDRGQRGTRRTLHSTCRPGSSQARRSSHVQYADLREKFRYSDVMLSPAPAEMRSQACQQLARSILLRTPYQHDPGLSAHSVIWMQPWNRVGQWTSPEQFKALGFLLTT
ncbi:FUSC family membrane protein [Shigella flexneri]